MLVGNRQIQLREFPDPTPYGSWTFSTVGLDECARFIVDRQVPLHRLITHRFSLDQADEAFRVFDGGATGKCVSVFP